MENTSKLVLPAYLVAISELLAVRILHEEMNN